jgi:hypothetical protein
LDGRIFEVAKGDWRSFVPPNGYNCRCSLESLAEVGEGNAVSTGAAAGKAMGAEFTQMRKEGFAVNRADLGIVFDLNKEYAETLKGVSTNVSTVGYADAGLATRAEIAKATSAKLPTSDITLKDAQDTFRAEQIGKGKDAVMVIGASDSGFPVGMKFDALGTNQKHIGLFTTLPDLINTPDELYMTTEKLLRYVKHYNDGMLVVDVAINDGKPTMNRWFTSDADNIRKGLLLKG